MARGWESKSVEAQQEDAAGRNEPGRPRLTREQAARFREQENLRLSLRNIVDQLERNSDPRRRVMLERAKGDLQRQMEDLRP